MQFIIFGEPQEKYKITILVKESDLNQDLILKHYVNPLINLNPNLTKEDFLVLPVNYVNKKAPVKTVLEPCLNQLQDYISEAGSEVLLVTAPEYFKKITGKTKVSNVLGLNVPAKFDKLAGVETFNSPSYRSVFFDDKNIGKIELALKGIAKITSGNNINHDIIHKAVYPKHTSDIKKVLDQLLHYPVLTCDIEAFSLKHTEAEIATISFAWSKHEGTAFVSQLYGYNEVNLLLYNFFQEYLGRKGGKIIFHNMNYDAKVLIHGLFQAGMVQAKESMLQGIELFTKNFEDTKLIAYLATNSCSGNELSLKQLALPFSGNYGLEDDAFQNLLDIPLNELLEYNLKDALSTFYVYETYYPLMVNDDQERVYKEIFKPAVKNLLQMELHGMPICMERVLEVEEELLVIQKKHLDILKASPLYKILVDIKQVNLTLAINKRWKNKLEDFNYFKPIAEQEVNLNSGTQLIDLLYTYAGLPVIDKTPTKAPATGTKTLKKLKNHVDSSDILHTFINNLIELSKVNKILEAFIPAFKDAYYDPITDFHYLFGNFNLGGTVSGRLSCSKP